MLALEQEVLRCSKTRVPMHVYGVQVPRCCPWRFEVASEEKAGSPKAAAVHWMRLRWHSHRANLSPARELEVPGATYAEGRRRRRADTVRQLGERKGKHQKGPC